MPTAYEKLSTLLKELFQLDQADLDFGIYRIMNQKRDEITRFLDHDLLPQVKTAFEHYQPADKNVLQERLEQASQAAATAGFDPEESPKVKEIREQIAHYSVDTVALENDVYSHLYSFFRRYYNEGDFISTRRYKEGVYAIPYEGEEVKLHWANADQYYVKTTENFRDYSFRLPSGRLAHFKIVGAETERDNVKADNEKDRRFILATENPITVEGDALMLRFEYRADADKRDQKALNILTIEQILNLAPIEWISELKALAPTEANPRRTLLEKRLADYSARNTFDYFIHKDLRTFLRRELDFYIKNEVMRLDDIEAEGVPQVEQYLSKIKVLRQIAHKIIEFLAQIEDFQKKLWLKKKFVVETNYCITLDRVPEALYPEICANDAQREEWVRLFAIDEIKGNLVEPGYSIPLTIEFLKANPFLVVDTKFFNQFFKDRAISNIEYFDNECNGLLINSENFQGLRLLENKYREKVKTIYIDPPYNTDSTPIVYKNGYRHSTWGSLMNDRLLLSMSLLFDRSVEIIAIDDTELILLSKIIEDMASDYRLTRVTVVHNPKGSITKDFNRVHEYALFLTKEDQKNVISRTMEENESPRKMRRWGENSLRLERPLSFYPIYVKDGEITRIGVVPSEKFHPSGRNVPQDTGEIEIWPIDQNGIERRWNFGLESIGNNLDRITIQEIEGTLDLFLTHEITVPKTIWTGGEFDAGNYGNTLLINILGQKLFDFPKSINLVEKCLYLSTNENINSIILDYFAGSGTTGHATINLNRRDGGNRQYIMVEMGSYFETVTKPRIQKVIYSMDWNSGKPVSREGSSHFFKYLRLESFEDTLNNLIFLRTQEQQLALEASPEFKENYLLSYMLDVESQNSLLNIQSFVHPFDYMLHIASGIVGESKPTKVDLVETFNYLIGLHVETIQSIRGFRVVTGKNPANERTLIIWRDLEEKDNATLEEFFRKQDYNPRDMEFDLIYVNGDNNLENLRKPDETWKVRLIEEEFLRLMFEEG